MQKILKNNIALQGAEHRWDARIWLKKYPWARVALQIRKFRKIFLEKIIKQIKWNLLNLDVKKPFNY